MRAFDWTRTPLGPPEQWPVGLKTAVRIMLTSRQAMWIGWGPELTYLYNDAYRSIIGGKHPAALGQPTQVVWGEIWNDIAPMLATALQGDHGTYVEAQLLIMERNGYPEETYYTFSYSPIPDNEGGTGGIICANTDDTERVVRERQLALLRQLAAAAAEARTVEQACERAGVALATAGHDLPFALIYLLDASTHRLSLAAAAGITSGHPGAPTEVSADAMAPWPFAAALHERATQVVGRLAHTVGALGTGAWDRPPQQALVVPLGGRGHERPGGLLVLGLNPYRLFDDAYGGFADLVAAQVASGLANASAYEDERRRADMLAELDRAKTAFFSNVSHELRTPLTLMLGPVEDILAKPHALASDDDRELLQVVHRNGLRLGKLVNNLLDFSRIEAGRVQANYEATDLGALTSDIVSVFRSAVERAGLRLTIDCPTLPDDVHVDREMWEKVVLNLVSNALKFTFDGEIAVRLRCRGDQVTLSVSDTGTGIPPGELPHLFERFHRIRGARARTQEGTGIGLALIQELVRLHGGTITVESELGRGTTFVVTLRTGTAHLPAEWVSSTPSLAKTSVRADAYVNEAIGWCGEATAAAEGGAVPSADAGRILLADDNGDMRNYVARLLGERWTVEAVADGEAALEAARRRAPELVVADVMMPGRDGFALIDALRDHEATRHVPVMLLSARAGQEATLEGLAAGAADYVVKPFTARDLLARVEAQLARARERAARDEQRLHLYALLMQAPTAITLLRGADHVIELANALVCAMWGRRQEDVIGRPLFEALPELRGQGVQEVLDGVLATGVSHADRELPVRLDRHGDGTLETAYFDFVYTPFRGRDGAVEGVFIVASEVTEQIRARRQIEHAYDEADRANRVKDEFLATLSHELRTPLNAILGWARILRGGDLQPEVQQRAFESVERNATAQAQLVEDLLDVSRIISGKLTIKTDIVDLSSVLSTAVDAVRPGAAAKRLRVFVDLEPHVPVLVSGDADRLQQVVWNLLSNAVKFTPGGGRIDVALRCSDSGAELVVADSGQGIEPAFLPYVFERFRQADSSASRQHGGLGLGLAIVRHLVEAHGGSVAVESRGARQGATFTIRLPMCAIAERPSGVRLATSERAEAAQLTGASALVVDDQVDARELMRYVLASRGVSVTTAASATEALEHFGRQPFDLLIADIGMPAQDGYSLIRAIRGLPERAGGPVHAVAVTAYASARERAMALEAGFDAHLPKPVEPERLVAIVSAALQAGAARRAP